MLGSGRVLLEQGARATRSSVATIISFSLFFEVSEAMYLNPRIVGSGERTLVLSHGYGGSQAIWDMVLPHLARRNKVRPSTPLTHHTYGRKLLLIVSLLVSI